MALLNINPAAIGETLATSAIGRAAQAIGQAMSPKMVQDVQGVLGKVRMAGQFLGLKTGISAIDGLLGLAGGSQESGTPLLGGLSLSQAKKLAEQQRAARVARKNLFFIRITDENVPQGVYADKPVSNSLGMSRIGAGIGETISGMVGSVASVGVAKIGQSLGGLAGAAAYLGSSQIGGAIGKMAGSAVSSAVGKVLGGGVSLPANSVGQIAVNSFDMLAMDVSYSDGVTSDQQMIGGTFIDKVTGAAPVEFQITTMDDEAGSIKRWFEGKLMQIRHRDGTMGLPAEYVFTVEIVHAIASPDVPNEHLAYRKISRVRASTMQVDLSRRDQALSEIQLTFAEFDPYMR